MTDHPWRKKLEEQVQVLENKLARERRRVADLDRKRIEYESIFQNVPLFILVVDEDRRVQEISHAILSDQGMDKEKVLGRRGGEALQCIHHLDNPNGCGFGQACKTCMIRSLVQDTLSNGKSHHRVEVRISMIGDTFKERILLVSTVLIQNDEKKKVQIFLEDITEQQLTEKALYIRERQQNAISQISQMAITQIDLSDLMDRATEILQKALKIDFTKILELQPDNDCFLLKSGYGWNDGLIGKVKIGTEKDSQSGFTLSSNQPVIVTDLNEERRFTAPPLLLDHSVVSGVSVIIGQAGNPYGVLGVHSKTHREFSLQDIHFIQSMADLLANTIDRKKTEKSLKESEENFRTIFNQAAVGVSLTSMQTGAILQVNRKYCDIIGYSKDELKNITSQKITHPDDLQTELYNIKQIKEGKLKDFSMEKRYKGKGDSIIWVNLTVSPMWHSNKEISQYISVIEDITQKKLMEDKVKVLSGLLPICASCKKIRDDRGYWRQIESYIEDHSEAEFSHGICPECAKKLYPKFKTIK